MSNQSGIENTDWDDPYTTCDICGEKILRGIISVSTHWAETHGKQQMDFIHKVANSPLEIKDKMDLIKKEFGLEQ